jgi:hypothetical protein
MRTLALSLITFFACSAAWADSPFDGTWQLNAAKSQLAGDTMSIDDAGGGTLKYTDSDQSYSFKPDGSPFTTPRGIERTFQKTSEGYTTTYKKNGLLIRTSTWKLSGDGNTLVIESKGTKPNGDTFDNATTYVRTAPGTGVIGGWKSTKVKLSNPNALTLQSNGDEVTLAFSAIKATCHAKWDGRTIRPPARPYPMDSRSRYRRTAPTASNWSRSPRARPSRSSTTILHPTARA